MKHWSTSYQNVDTEGSIGLSVIKGLIQQESLIYELSKCKYSKKHRSTTYQSVDAIESIVPSVIKVLIQ